MIMKDIMRNSFVTMTMWLSYIVSITAACISGSIAFYRIVLEKSYSNPLKVFGWSVLIHIVCRLYFHFLGKINKY